MRIEDNSVEVDITKPQDNEEFDHEAMLKQVANTAKRKWFIRRIISIILLLTTITMIITGYMLENPILFFGSSLVWFMSIKFRYNAAAYAFITHQIEAGHAYGTLINENGEIVSSTDESIMEAVMLEKIGREKKFGSSEAYCIVVSNVPPLTVSQIKDALIQNEVNHIKEYYSTIERNMTMTFEKLNDAKAARNVLKAQDYTVGDVIECQTAKA